MSFIPSARNKAIQYLAMREHSYLELFRKLTQKGYEDSEVVAALDKLIEDALLSDERYGEAFVRSRVSKGYGPLRIQMELRDKGLDEYQIERSLTSEIIDWINVLEGVWFKKYSLPLDESAAERARQWRFLQYRGFTPSQINALYRRLSEQSPTVY